MAVLPEPAPFALAFEKDAVTVEAGQKAEVKLRCDRPGPDFRGPVTVIELARPGPFQFGQVTVPEGKSEATVTFNVQAGARPGRYTFALLGQGQVPFSKDGKAKANTLVYITEAGYIAVVPFSGKFVEGARSVKGMDGMGLRSRKGTEKFEEAKKFGVEMFLDNRTENIIYLSETGAIAVLPK